MTEKRYTCSELNNCQYSIDYTTFKEIYGEENIFHSRICEVNNKKQAQKVVDLLNKQEQQIKELEERNQRQCERLKEVWDLIFDRNWEELEKKAIEIEENEKLLQKEHGDVE